MKVTEIFPYQPLSPIVKTQQKKELVVYLRAELRHLNGRKADLEDQLKEAEDWLAKDKGGQTAGVQTGGQTAVVQTGGQTAVVQTATEAQESAGNP